MTVLVTIDCGKENLCRNVAWPAVPRVGEYISWGKKLYEIEMVTWVTGSIAPKLYGVLILVRKAKP